MKTAIAILLVLAASAGAQTAGSNKLSPAFAKAARRALIAHRNFVTAAPDSMEKLQTQQEMRMRNVDAEAEIQTRADQRFNDEVLDRAFDWDLVGSCMTKLTRVLVAMTYLRLPADCTRTGDTERAAQKALDDNRKDVERRGGWAVKTERDAKVDNMNREAQKVFDEIKIQSKERP